MKIIHTADLHFGQIIYQNYDRSDEHSHFFDQINIYLIDSYNILIIITIFADRLQTLKS